MSESTDESTDVGMSEGTHAPADATGTPSPQSSPHGTTRRARAARSGPGHHSPGEAAASGHASSRARSHTHTHSHTHSHAAPVHVPGGPARVRRVRLILGGAVLALLVPTLIVTALLWPTSTSLIGSQPFIASGTSLARAHVTSLDPSDCLDSTAALTAALGDADAGTSLGTDLLADAVCARITAGTGAGTVFPVHVPAENLGAAQVGDDLELLYSPEALASGTPYVFIDYERGTPLTLLAGLYLLLIVAVAGLKGVRAVGGLVLAGLVLVVYMIPALLDGSQPLAVTLSGSMLMMIASLYLAHGVSVRTTTALLGTVVGVVVTAVLALWGVAAADLTGTVGESATTLMAALPHLDMQALLTCGMVIAGLGVLNDVTITQASAVWELHAANPALGRRRLFTSGMRIGRDHIASTVYTLAFAYAGTALPLVLVASLIDRAVLETVTSGEIAEEIVRTLVSCVGLVLAIPATTAIAAVLCSPRREG